MLKQHAKYEICITVEYRSKMFYPRDAMFVQY